MEKDEKDFIKQLDDKRKFEIAVMNSIIECDNENDKNFKDNQDLLNNLMPSFNVTIVNDILTRNHDEARLKANFTQCKNCKLLVQRIECNISQCNKAIEAGYGDLTIVQIMALQAKQDTQFFKL